MLLANEIILKGESQRRTWTWDQVLNSKSAENGSEGLGRAKRHEKIEPDPIFSRDHLKLEH